VSRSGKDVRVTTYESTMWDQLLTFLGALGEVRETSPGRIRLRVRASGRELEIVMTPAEWVEMSSVKWGSFADAAEDVRRTVSAAGEDDRFLVYADYALEPSPRPTLEADPALERLDALLRANDGKAIGSWVAHGDDATPYKRFSDFPD
jgi:hypothetical protein